MKIDSVIGLKSRHLGSAEGRCPISFEVNIGTKYS